MTDDSAGHERRKAADGEPEERRRAPRRAWVAAIGAGLLVTAATSLAVAAWRPPGLPAEFPTWGIFGVFAIVWGPLWCLLGWLVFVAPHTVERLGRAEDTVEHRWMQESATWAVAAIMVVCGLGAATLSLTGWSPEPVWVLVTVGAVGMGTQFGRYALIVRRER